MCDTLLFHKSWKEKYVSTGKWIKIKCDKVIQWNINHEKEQSTDPCYDMDKPWKYWVKWKKLNQADHILYDSIYMKCL